MIRRLLVNQYEYKAKMDFTSLLMSLNQNILNHVSLKNGQRTSLNLVMQNTKSKHKRTSKKERSRRRAARSLVEILFIPAFFHEIHPKLG
jgi:hypothetical protein